MAWSPGVGGAPLAGTLAVHVQDEDDSSPIAGASVDVGGAPVLTDADGNATLPTSSGSVTLRVVAAGFVTERWIGVDRARAAVALAAPVSPRALTATVSGGEGDTAVGVMTALSILRASSVVGSTGTCVGGACELSLTAVDVHDPETSVVIIDANGARARTVSVAGGRFAIELTGAAAGAPLLPIDVVLPSGVGLEGVVGVPGMRTAGGVTLLPDPSGAAVTRALPSADAALPTSRFWYVARGTTTDGSGESMAFDRDVGTDGVATLPASFLAIPSATRAAAGDAVGIDVDPEVDLYVVETLGERVLVLRPTGAHVDVPIPTSAVATVTVRAVDAPASGEGIDLGAAELFATRVATRTL